MRANPLLGELGEVGGGDGYECLQNIMHRAV
jgi:hypothetical protein